MSDSGQYVFVDKQTLPFTDPDSGQVTQIPAIDPRWCERVEYGRFYALTGQEYLMAKSWKTQITLMESGLHHLRRLSFHQFWSVVCFDQDFHAMLKSFFLHCPRPSDGGAFRLQFGTSSVAQHMAVVWRNVLIVCMRMVEQRDVDNPSQGLSQEFYRAALHTTGVWSVTRLMDLCSIFNATATATNAKEVTQNNRKLVLTIVKSCIKTQPQYQQDLVHVCQAMKHIFDKCEQRVCRAGFIAPSSTACGTDYQGPKLTTGTSTALERDTLRELCCLLVDLVCSLLHFIEFYPAFLNIMHKEGLTERIPDFYEKVFGGLMHELTESKHIGGFNTDKPQLRGRLLMFEGKLLLLFRRLIERNYLRHVQEATSNAKGTGTTRPLVDIHNNLTVTQQHEKDLNTLGDDFVNLVLDKMLHNEQFVWLYNKEYPLSEDLCALGKGTSIDAAQTLYIRDALLAVEMRLAQQALAKLHKRGMLKGIGCVNEVENSALHEKMDSVCDMLPDMSRQLAHLCLVQFGEDVERTIDALLNESSKLPKDLRKLMALKNLDLTAVPNQLAVDNSLVDVSHGRERRNERLVDLAPPSSLSGLSAAANDLRTLTNQNTSAHSKAPMSSLEEELLKEPSTTPVFNSSILTNDQPKLQRITTGKKHGQSLNAEMPNADRDALRSFYAQHEYETRNSDEEYDDEYDDTYDDRVQADDAPGNEDRLKSMQKNREFTTNNPNHIAPPAPEPLIGQTSATTNQHMINANNNNNNQGGGMRNVKSKPTQAAAAAAASQAQPSDTNHPSQSRGPGQDVRQQQNTNTDYTGGRQRQDKDRNRQQTAHHDRKRMAQKKQRGGMI